MIKDSFEIFPLGQILCTPGVLRACSDAWRIACLNRHVRGDWGVVGREDAAENALALTEGFRILSAYPLDPAKPCQGHGKNCLWIITEADRSASTFLLPDEY